MAKRKKIIIVALSALAAVMLTGFVFFRKEEKPVMLQTEKPQFGYISESVTATGTIQPVDTVAVGTQVSGTIKNIYADFNSVVKKGQLLAVLDKSLFATQVAQYTANLAGMNSQLLYQQKNIDRQTALYFACK